MSKVSLFLAIGFALFVIRPASAQEGIGIVGGLNIANLTNVDNLFFDSSNRTGLAIGVCFGDGVSFLLGKVSAFVEGRLAPGLTGLSMPMQFPGTPNAMASRSVAWN